MRKVAVLIALSALVLLGFSEAFAQGGPAPICGAHPLPPCTTPSSDAASQSVASSSASSIIGSINAALGSAIGGEGSGSQGGQGAVSDLGLVRGQSAGSAGNGLGVWAMGGGFALNSSKPNGIYSGSLGTGMLGVDKSFGSLVLGLGLGVERLDLDTKYNKGSMSYDGYTLAPYAAYALTRDTVLDAMLVLTSLRYTMRETQTNTQYGDHMSSSRDVVSVGASHYIPIDKLLLSGRLATLYLDERQHGYVMNKAAHSSARIYTWQGIGGLRGTYDLGAFKPFLGVNYMYDIVKSGGKRDDVWETDFDLGFNWAAANQFSLGLTGTFGIRENFTKAGGMLNLRYDF